MGLRRKGVSAEVIDALEKAYKLIYKSKLNVSQAVSKIKQDPTLRSIPEVQNVLTFIEKSKRGILSAPRRLQRD